MGAILQFAFEFVTEICCRSGCGVAFAMPKRLKEDLLKTRESFYCPHGHAQHYIGKTEIEQLREQKDAEIARIRQRLTWAESNELRHRQARARAERRSAAYKGVLTKTKKRVGNGVCPCCNRTFQNLQRHMHGKHPNYKGKL